MTFLERWFGGADAGAPIGDPERVATVQRILEELAPAIAADGGSIELVEVVEDGWVVVRLRGACSHCAASDMTLRGALEPKLQAAAGWYRGLRAI